MKKLNYILFFAVAASVVGCGKGSSVNPAPTKTTTTTESLAADSVTIFAGVPDQFGIINGTLKTATFENPLGMCLDEAGNIYVADYFGYDIREVSASGNVSTLAGNSTKGFVNGPAATSEFFAPLYVAADGAGNVYEIQEYFDGNTGNGALRKISKGIVSTVAFGHFFGITADIHGDIFVSTASEIMKLDFTTGTLKTFAGSAGTGTADGTGASASFKQITTLTADPNGNIFAMDNFRIRKINTSSAGVTTMPLQGSNPFELPQAIAADQWDNIYVANEGKDQGFVLKITPDGTASVFAGKKTGSTVGFHGAPLSVSIPLPQGITVLPSGNILVSSGQDAIIQEIVTHQQ